MEVGIPNLWTTGVVPRISFLTRMLLAGSLRARSCPGCWNDVPWEQSDTGRSQDLRPLTLAEPARQRKVLPFVIDRPILCEPNTHKKKARVQLPGQFIAPWSPTASGPHCGQWSVSPPGQDCSGGGEERIGAPQGDMTSERSIKNTVRSTTLWGFDRQQTGSACPVCFHTRVCLSPQTVAIWIPRDARPQEGRTGRWNLPCLFDLLIKSVLVLLSPVFHVTSDTS